MATPALPGSSRTARLLASGDWRRGRQGLRGDVGDGGSFGHPVARWSRALRVEPRAQNALYRFTIPAALRDEILERLRRMNVNAATLFPDLAGLARSLRTVTVTRPVE